jgi:hypothetical protein
MQKNQKEGFKWTILIISFGIANVFLHTLSVVIVDQDD